MTGSLRPRLTPEGLFIPTYRFLIPIRWRWDGTNCPDEDLHAMVTLDPWPQGVLVNAFMPCRPDVRVPDAPVGTRVPELWTYDVVELFLSGPEGYLEVEIGAGGHFLILSFSQPRVMTNAHEDFRPDMVFHPRTEQDMWNTEMILPEWILPKGMNRVNATAIARGEFLSNRPLHGPKPDFHQPRYFKYAPRLGTLPQPPETEE